jgi:DNA-cytosine methyltransferase
MSTDNKTVIFKLAELFCGPGGLALGATSSSSIAGDGTLYKVKSVWANDIDESTCKTYAKNIHNNKNSAVICKPIEKVDFKKIPKFDSLAFGFPCNDFSVVGEQKGFGGRYGPLYTYGVKAISLFNPKWFIAENVSGLQSANNGKAFEKILHDLENAGKGYFLTTNLYKFEEYGVPQTRHRIVIVGIRKRLRTHAPHPFRTRRGDDGLPGAPGGDAPAPLHPARTQGARGNAPGRRRGSRALSDRLRQPSRLGGRSNRRAAFHARNIR